jgi:hypothetical protein
VTVAAAVVAAAFPAAAAAAAATAAAAAAAVIAIAIAMAAGLVGAGTMTAGLVGKAVTEAVATESAMAIQRLSSMALEMEMTWGVAARRHGRHPRCCCRHCYHIRLTKSIRHTHGLACFQALVSRMMAAAAAVAAAAAADIADIADIAAAGAVELELVAAGVAGGTVFGTAAVGVLPSLRHSLTLLVMKLMKLIMMLVMVKALGMMVSYGVWQAAEHVMLLVT